MSLETVPDNLKQRIKNSYDAIAPKFNAWTIPHSQQRLHYLDKLLHLLGDIQSRPVSVLELGCGCGIPVTQKLLSHDNFFVTANDLSTTQIQAARDNLQAYEDRTKLIEGDMAALTFPDATFDAVVGMYSLIHLPRAEQAELIAKISKWLKPGGCLLANFSEEVAEGVVYERWLSDEGWVYWSGWGAEQTLAEVASAGLKIVVGEILKDVVDASFIWVIARKNTS
jgi:ubiquinone/menaquinone biosynthesis C-methylase UbiE